MEDAHHSRPATPTSPPPQKRSKIDDAPLRMEAESSSAVKVNLPKKKRFKKPPPPELGSSEDVILRDVMALLGAEAVEAAVETDTDYKAPIEKGIELDVEISTLSSNGEALALVPSSHSGRPWVIVVPFCLPEENVRVRVFAHSRLHSLADLISVVSTNDEMRDNSRIKCRYFGTCAGCQYQMLSYDTQLQLKQEVVRKAYKNYSGLPSHLLPPILPTMPSPKTYGYRTKITPHFDLPTNSRRKNREVDSSKLSDVAIGFGEKGRRRVLDIEECVIATPVLNQALPKIRADVKEKIHTYKRGATLLLRDSWQRTADSSASSPDNPPSPFELIQDGESHLCITDYKAQVLEKVGSTSFEFPAGSFFQNNNSVLSPLVDYVREAIFAEPTDPSPTHLVDTYCGAGFFGISLAPHFVHVAGVEISVDSIKSANHNATLNNLPPPTPSDSVRTESLSFSAGKSESIFQSVSHFPPLQTVVIIDPPRKGCDILFLQQLVQFKPLKIVYVSCNVHTQARDLGQLLKLMADDAAEGPKQTYTIYSLRGFDLFPQTAHVESVAVLTLA